MEVKPTVIVLLALTLVVNLIDADIFYNRPLKRQHVDGKRYKCVPGRTIIKVSENRNIMPVHEPTDSEEYRRSPSRKYHMTAQTKDETCKICVCSVDGKAEYCSNRPAETTNECLRMKDITDKFNMGLPYEHSNSLAYRIRRDYIWHNDEIPYSSKAKCFRGHSYYTNSLTANDTDIDVGSDVNSLLDYPNTFTCYYCVCSVSGDAVGCIHRDVSFCNFYRVVRSEKHIRDRYTSLMGQDRPAFFRQLSYRLRRAMDSGIYELLDAGGDTLCCNHPDGHRRQIHNQVRYKLRTMMKRIPKENLLGQTRMSMKGDYEDFIVNNDKLNHVGDKHSKKKCVPFISEYTNCNEDNACSGCSRCKCDGDGQWQCQDMQECPADNIASEEVQKQDEAIFDDALKILEANMNKKKKANSKVTGSPYVPEPPKKNFKVTSSPYLPAPQKMLTLSEEEDDLLVFHKQREKDEAFFAHPTLSRYRRSTVNKNNKHTKISVDKLSIKSKGSSQNNTVKKDSIDEINEDTLKNSNLTGTLVAKKIDMLPPLSGTRRSGFADITSKALQIEYSQPKSYNPITDNKIEHESKFDSSHENLKTVLGNYTQNTKNNDLSKIVVNELKKGSEIIGDISAAPVSNITFTPENDTLTAMAFIAGNLLNKLWDMEKDASASSTETDGLKHEKISDLLELFKEPLNMRQETFLKNALEQLSSAIDKHKDVKNISICETINEAEKLFKANGTSDEGTTAKAPCRKKATDDKRKKNTEGPENKQKKTKTETEIIQKEATMKAIAKINNVVDLIKKFEYIQGKLSELKHGTKLVFNRTGTELTEDEEDSFNMFGSLLEKITKLLLPKRNNRKIANVMKNQNYLKSNDNLKKKFEKLYNVDLTNMTVSAKDQLILDYLTHVDRNPDCLLKNTNHEVEVLPSVEGNILLNLSEFFKLKSFSDLIKLIEPDKAKAQETPNVTQIPTVATTVKETEDKDMLTRTKGVNYNKFNSTKEKLKEHLKTIMEDLIEIQSAKGVSFKGNIKVSDALPCIYNLLKSDTQEVVKKEENIDPVKKIASIFQGLKKELKESVSRRTTGNTLTVRPKSAVVWERLVNNLASKTPVNSRRSLKSKTPKSYDAIREMIEGIENGSSTYKHQALLVQTPATGKLMLLKLLEQDAKAAIDIISEMKLSFDSIAKLPTEQYTEIEEFVGNMETSIKLSEKVNEKVQSDQRIIDSEINKILKTKLKKNPNFETSELSPRRVSDQTKISRIQIVNQLIRNRVETFIKMKEVNGSDVQNDVTYNIAQRIKFYLDIGNYKLANELFRFFVMQRQNGFTKDKFIVSSTPRIIIQQPMRRRMSQPPKEADHLVGGPEDMKLKHMNWATQDHLIKQLLNIKNMGL